MLAATTRLEQRVRFVVRHAARCAGTRVPHPCASLRGFAISALSRSVAKLTHDPSPTRATE
jgi:hypothetical protein